MGSKKLDKFAPDYKHQFLLQKQHNSHERKKGFWRVAQATDPPFNTRRWISDLGLCSDKELEIAIEAGYVAEVDGQIILTGEPLTPEMWRDEWLDLNTGELLDKPRQKLDKLQQWSEPPIIAGCKCRNADQPNRSSWIFTGWEADGIKQVAEYLEKELGIPIYLAANGKNGNYILTLPLYVQGEVNLSATPTWKTLENMEENNHVNCFTATTNANG